MECVLQNLIRSILVETAACMWRSRRRPVSRQTKSESLMKRAIDFVQGWIPIGGGRRVYGETKEVVSVRWWTWKRLALCMLVLASLPFLFPVLFLSLFVGLMFSMPLLCGVAAYLVVFRGFSLPWNLTKLALPKLLPAQRASGSQTRVFIRQAEGREGRATVERQGREHSNNLVLREEGVEGIKPAQEVSEFEHVAEETDRESSLPKVSGVGYPIEEQPGRQLPIAVEVPITDIFPGEVNTDDVGRAGVKIDSGELPDNDVESKSDKGFEISLGEQPEKGLKLEAPVSGACVKDQGEGERDAALGFLSCAPVQLGEQPAQEVREFEHKAEETDRHSGLLGSRADDWQTRKERWEAESRPGGLLQSAPNMEPHSFEARSMWNPLFEFSTPSPIRRRSSAGASKDFTFTSSSDFSQALERHSAPEYRYCRPSLSDSALSPPHRRFREIKKGRYRDWSEHDHPAKSFTPGFRPRSYSASWSESLEPYEGEFEGLLQYWQERDKATPSPTSSTKYTSAKSSAVLAAQLRQEINTIQRIVGQDIEPQHSLWKDVESLSELVGMELPYMGDVSDLMKAMQGLDLLKVVVGIRWDVEQDEYSR